MRPVRLSRSITAKVTADEYEQIAQSAVEQNRNMSEHVRELLLKGAPRPSAQELEVVLGEVLSLRSILLTLVYRINIDARFSEQEMREVIQRADADKDQRAQIRIADALTRKDNQ